MDAFTVGAAAFETLQEQAIRRQNRACNEGPRREERPVILARRVPPNSGTTRQTGPSTDGRPTQSFTNTTLATPPTVQTPHAHTQAFAGPSSHSAPSRATLSGDALIRAASNVTQGAASLGTHVHALDGGGQPPVHRSIAATGGQNTSDQHPGYPEGSYPRTLPDRRSGIPPTPNPFPPPLYEE